METIEKQYKGYVISYLKIPLMGAMFTVNVGSEDRNLMLKLNPDDRVISGTSMADAIAKAEQRIDQILDD